MNKIARALGSPLAFGAGVASVIALLIVGVEVGWRSEAFQVARLAMTIATLFGLMVVLWSRVRRLQQAADRLGSHATAKTEFSPDRRNDA